ncbi:hypothetical protein DV737_g5457, partial [Chaetothyriales sp. CBS 132003]
MSNTSAGLESKTAKKRRAKAEQSIAAADTASHSSDPAPAASISGHGHANGDFSADSAYVKELNRQIRNIHKKISASAKADAVIADNPGKSLDELVAEKKLNGDQKAQILKKPGLQTQLSQLEEQLGQYRAFSQELEERFSREKAALIDAHQRDVAGLRQEIETLSQTPKAKDIDDELKLISHFLHAAASKRQSEDADSEEVRAFEGILLQIYQGNLTALTTLRNLITGSEEKVSDTENNPLDITFAQVKIAALAEAAEGVNATEEEASAAATGAATAPEPASDPTVAPTGITELDNTAAAPIQTAADSAAALESTPLPPQASTASEAANHVAESGWNPGTSTTPDGSAIAEEWIHVSSKPAEADTSLFVDDTARPEVGVVAAVAAAAVVDQEATLEAVEEAAAVTAASEAAAVVHAQIVPHDWPEAKGGVEALHRVEASLGSAPFI